MNHNIPMTKSEQKYTCFYITKSATVFSIHQEIPVSYAPYQCFNNTAKVPL